MTITAITAIPAPPAPNPDAVQDWTRLRCKAAKRLEALAAKLATDGLDDQESAERERLRAFLGMRLTAWLAQTGRV
jgi:hypothetical protein